MKLQYDFMLEVRNLFIDCWQCWECGQNGQATGGLSLHHIWGRISGSAFNAALLCTFCHEKVTGALEERLRYFGRTFRFLLTLARNGAFTLGPRDESFIALVYGDIKDLLSTVLLVS